MMLTSLIKHTDPDHKDQPFLKHALELIISATQKINAATGAVDNMKKIISIDRKFYGSSTFVSPGRVSFKIHIVKVI